MDNLDDINNPGFRKLNMNPGDQLSLSRVLRKQEPYDELTAENEELESSIEQTNSDIVTAENEIDSTQTVVDKLSERQAIFEEIKDDKKSQPTPRSPKTANEQMGVNLGKGLGSFWIYSQEKSRSKSYIEKRERDIDSMNFENNVRKIIIKKNKEKLEENKSKQ